jgi:multiple antibiotic resistance protein
MKYYFLTFLETFIPLFVAVDMIGLLPVYVNITRGLGQKEKKIILFQSLLTATLIALGFILIGKAIFNFLGITVSDFQIAGGLVLLVLAIMDLLTSQKSEEKQTFNSFSGVVPIGVPLIIGPAVLTTVIIQVDSHGLWITLLAILSNIFLIGVIFSQSHWFIKILGENGAKAISKIISLLLAAIAVMMIRMGLVTLIEPFLR